MSPFVLKAGFITDIYYLLLNLNHNIIYGSNIYPQLFGQLFKYRDNRSILNPLDRVQGFGIFQSLAEPIKHGLPEWDPFLQTPRYEGGRSCQRHPNSMWRRSYWNSMAAQARIAPCDRNQAASRVREPPIGTKSGAHLEAYKRIELIHSIRLNDGIQWRKSWLPIFGEMAFLNMALYLALDFFLMV